VTSPTQRTLAWLREQGYVAEVVERFNPHVKVRHDLYGHIDVLGLGDTILAVQATAAGVSDRLKKILALEAETGLPGRWLRAGGRTEIHGWAKRRSKAKNADGTRSKRMETRLRRIVLRWDAERGLVSEEVA
jgi:hypothetical protein